MSSPDTTTLWRCKRVTNFSRPDLHWCPQCELDGRIPMLGVLVSYFLNMPRQEEEIFKRVPPVLRRSMLFKPDMQQSQDKQIHECIDRPRLAWWMMERDAKRQVESSRSLRKLLRELMDCGASEDRLLQLSYLPTRIFDTLALRENIRNGRAERKPLLQRIMNPRTLLSRKDPRLGRLISYYEDWSMPPEQARPAIRDSVKRLGVRSERALWSELCLISPDVKIHRHPIWNVVFIPLVEYLRTFDYDHPKRSERDDRKKSSREGREGYEKDLIPDVVYAHASRLVSLRYPRHWPDRERLVKARHRKFLTSTIC